MLQAGSLLIVASRRTHLFNEFSAWASAELRCQFSEICTTGLLLGTALVGYGKFLFYSGAPKYTFSETINACADRFKHYDRFTRQLGWSFQDGRKSSPGNGR